MLLLLWYGYKTSNSLNLDCRRNSNSYYLARLSKSILIQIPAFVEEIFRVTKISPALKHCPPSTIYRKYLKQNSFVTYFLVVSQVTTSMLCSIWLLSLCYCKIVLKIVKKKFWQKIQIQWRVLEWIKITVVKLVTFSHITFNLNELIVYKDFVQSTYLHTL